MRHRQELHLCQQQELHLYQQQELHLCQYQVMELCRNPECNVFLLEIQDRAYEFLRMDGVVCQNPSL